MKTFEFTEQEAELLRKEQYKYLINDNIDHFLLLVQQIVSERITHEPGGSGQKRESPFIGEITISDLRKLFAHRASRISEDINQGANQLMTLTDFRLALADMRWRIYNDGLSEPGESGQSAEDELMRKVFYSSLKHTSDFPINNMKLFKELSFEMMTTYASQVCADKDARIKELEGLLSSDSVYGLFRFAYKSPESAQVYEISKKLRELKTK